MDISKVFEVVKQAAVFAVRMVEEFAGSKSAEEKKKEAVSIIKGALDKLVNVPDGFDFMEEYLIGVMIDFVVKYCNEQGIFSHKETRAVE